MRLWWRYSVWILLAGSLALNVFFLGGYWQARRDAQRVESGPGARGLIVERLDLDETQRRKLETLAARLASSAERARDETRSLQLEFWEELATASPDGDRLASLLEGMTDARLRYQQDTLAAALEFLETLSPDQRREFRALIREHDPLGLRSLTGSLPRSRDRRRDAGRDERGARRERPPATY